MRVLVGCLVALFGAIAGVALSIASVYWLLGDAGADAFTWIAAVLFFCLFGIPLGAGLRVLVVARRHSKRQTPLRSSN